MGDARNNEATADAVLDASRPARSQCSIETSGRLVGKREGIKVGVAAFKERAASRQGV